MWEERKDKDSMETHDLFENLKKKKNTDLKRKWGLILRILLSVKLSCATRLLSETLGLVPALLTCMLSPRLNRSPLNSA